VIIVIIVALLIGIFRKNAIKFIVELVVDFAISIGFVFALNFVLLLPADVDFILIGVGTVAMLIGSIISHLDKTGVPAT